MFEKFRSFSFELNFIIFVYFILPLVIFLSFAIKDFFINQSFDLLGFFLPISLLVFTIILWVYLIWIDKNVVWQLLGFSDDGDVFTISNGDRIAYKDVKSVFIGPKERLDRSLSDVNQSDIRVSLGNAFEYLFDRFPMTIEFKLKNEIVKQTYVGELSLYGLKRLALDLEGMGIEVNSVEFDYKNEVLSFLKLPLFACAGFLGMLIGMGIVSEGPFYGPMLLFFGFQ